MTLPMTIALLAVVLSLVALLGLVAVYGRLRQLEAGASADISGYSLAKQRIAPVQMRPAGDGLSIVVLLDQNCALCDSTWNTVSEFAANTESTLVRFIGVSTEAGQKHLSATARTELVADTSIWAELFEGYSPTLLVVNPAGAVQKRKFVYPDTDISAFLSEVFGSVHTETSIGSRS